MPTYSDDIMTENLSDVLLSELVNRGCLLRLTCPHCGKSSTTRGRFFGRRYEDITFGEFLEKLVCRRGGGCGRKGLLGEITPPPVTVEKQYAALGF